MDKFKERYNQIVDEVYEKYITQIRIEFEKWCARNPYTLVNYREDTKELFLKSIKEDTHWFTGEKNFSEKWGLKIEERELSVKERLFFVNKSNEEYEKALANKTQYESIGLDFELALTSRMNELNIPTKLITVTYKDEKIEVYE